MSELHDPWWPLVWQQASDYNHIFEDYRDHFSDDVMVAIVEYGGRKLYVYDVPWIEGTMQRYSVASELTSDRADDEEDFHTLLEVRCCLIHRLLGPER